MNGKLEKIRDYVVKYDHSSFSDEIHSPSGETMYFHIYIDYNLGAEPTLVVCFPDQSEWLEDKI